MSCCRKPRLSRSSPCSFLGRGLVTDLSLWVCAPSLPQDRTRDQPGNPVEAGTRSLYRFSEAHECRRTQDVSVSQRPPGRILFRIAQDLETAGAQEKTVFASVVSHGLSLLCHIHESFSERIIALIVQPCIELYESISIYFEQSVRPVGGHGPFRTGNRCLVLGNLLSQRRRRRAGVTAPANPGDRAGPFGKKPISVRLNET